MLGGCFVSLHFLCSIQCSPSVRWAPQHYEGSVPNKGQEVPQVRTPHPRMLDAASREKRPFRDGGIGGWILGRSEVVVALSTRDRVTYIDRGRELMSHVIIARAFSYSSLAMAMATGNVINNSPSPPLSCRDQAVAYTRGKGVYCLDSWRNLASTS